MEQQKLKPMTHNGTISFDYILERKDIKSLRLKVDRNGGVVVTVPLFCTRRSMDVFLTKNEKWVSRKRAELNKKTRGVMPSFEQDEYFVVLGERLNIRYETSTKNAYALENGALIIRTKDDGALLRKKQFDAFLETTARAVLKNRFDEVFSERFSDFTFKPALAVKRMKRSFGRAFINKGVVTLNTFLVVAPERLIDYVVVHELTHFLNPNHQKGFYDELWLRMEDHRERERELKKNYLPSYEY